MKSQVIRHWSRREETRHALAWEKCRKAMLAPGGPEEYCGRIEGVFSRYGLGTEGVRDAACGTGCTTFPLSGAEYSDGSEVMVELFNKQERNRPKHARCAPWQNIAHEPDKSHSILVLGNSVPYAGSWAKKTRAEGFAAHAIRAVQSALKAFYEKLEKGGVLFFDLYGEREGEKHEFAVDDEKFVWKVARDPGKKLRVWELTRTSGSGEKEAFTLSSLLLPHEEWISALKQAGFRNVEKLTGQHQFEPAYAAFAAFKRGIVGR